MNVVITDGELPRPEIEVPAYFSKKEGGDFVIKLLMDKESMKLLSVTIVFYDENGTEQENLNVTNYLQDGILTVPAAEVLQYGRTDAGVSVEYKIGGYYTGSWHDFRIVP